MKSNCFILHEPARNSYAFVIERTKEELVFRLAGSERILGRDVLYIARS